MWGQGEGPEASPRGSLCRTLCEGRSHQGISRHLGVLFCFRSAPCIRGGESP